MVRTYDSTRPSCILILPIFLCYCFSALMWLCTPYEAYYPIIYYSRFCLNSRRFWALERIQCRERRKSISVVIVYFTSVASLLSCLTFCRLCTRSWPDRFRCGLNTYRNLSFFGVCEKVFVPRYYGYLDLLAPSQFKPHFDHFMHNLYNPKAIFHWVLAKGWGVQLHKLVKTTFLNGNWRTGGDRQSPCPSA